MKRNPFIIGLAAAVFVVALSGVAGSYDRLAWGSGSSDASMENPPATAETPMFQESDPVETGAPPTGDKGTDESGYSSGGRESVPESGVIEERMDIDSGP